MHLFTACDKVKELWNFVHTLVTNLNLSPEIILFNTCTPNPKFVENVIVLITKHYIYRSRCKNEMVKKNLLVNYLKEYKNIEANSAKRRGLTITHAQKWEKVDI